MAIVSPFNLASPGVQASGPVVIVADDDDTARRNHSKILRARGFNTRAASSANDVLVQLADNPTAIVVTDYCMPSTDGLSLIDKARRVAPGVVFVMVTGMTTLDPQEVRTGREALFKVVFKPVDAQELVDVVEGAIGFQRQNLGRGNVPDAVTNSPKLDSWPQTVLIIDDDAVGAARIQSCLPAHVANSKILPTLAEGLGALHAGGVDMVVFDMSVGDAEGPKGVERIRSKSNTVAVLVTSTKADEATVGEALRRGAHEFIGKQQIDAVTLRRAARRARDRTAAEKTIWGSVDVRPEPAQKELSLGDATQKRLVERLRNSVEQKEFAIHLQAQVALRDGAVEGAEALVRWTPKEGEAAHPGIFIPVLEETGLINRVGDLVFEMACDRVAAWTAKGNYKGRLSVNLSGHQFDDDDLVGRFVDMARARKVSPDRLELEITESTMLKNITRCEQMVQAFKDVGFRIALDDFGTGYSSLAYLHRLPVDVLKIDRSMVMSLGKGQQVETICGAMIDLGCKLGLEIVAEGVETVDQMLFLRNAGAHKGQGFLMARPNPDFSPHVALESEPKWKPALLEAAALSPHVRPTPTRLRAVTWG